MIEEPQNRPEYPELKKDEILIKILWSGLFVIVGLLFCILLLTQNYIIPESKILTEEQINTQIANKFRSYEDKDGNCFSIYGFNTPQEAAFLVDCPVPPCEEEE
jgi:hypothetical protein